MARRSPPGRYRIVWRPQGLKGPAELLYDPLPKQDELHACPSPNIFYGGQAGGGKSKGLRWHGLHACLKYKRARVLLLRRNYADLDKHHLLELPLEIPPGLATYNENKKRLWFPSMQSAFVFGHCQYEKDIGQYLSSEWDVILIDEASQFTPAMLRNLRSRLRTTKTDLQPQFICGSNPGGEGHLWLKQRFLDKRPPKDEERDYDPDEWVFIPSALEDNEYLDTKQYDRQFSSMTEQEYKAYRQGDWEAFAGQFFSDYRRALHVIPEGHPLYQPAQDYQEIGLCMDWAWSPGIGYVGWYATDLFAGVIGYKEFTFQELSGEEAAAAIVKRCTEPEKNAIITADPSMWLPQASKKGVSIATEMDDAFISLGVGLRMSKANSDRPLGWQRMKGYMRPNRKHPDGTVAPYVRWLEGPDGSELGCPYLVSTIGAQMYSDTIIGDMKKGATDHGCDSARYFLMQREALIDLPELLDRTPSHDERRLNRTREMLKRAAAEHNEGISIDDDTMPMVEVSERQIRIAEEVADLWN